MIDPRLEGDALAGDANAFNEYLRAARRGGSTLRSLDTFIQRCAPELIERNGSAYPESAELVRVWTWALCLHSPKRSPRWDTASVDVPADLTTRDKNYVVYTIPPHTHLDPIAWVLFQRECTYVVVCADDVGLGWDQYGRERVVAHSLPYTERRLIELTPAARHSLHLGFTRAFLLGGAFEPFIKASP